MTFREKMIGKRMILGFSLTLAVSLGLSPLAAQADEVVTYTLSGDVVNLVDTSGHLLMTPNGELISSDGKVVSVVTTPGVTFVSKEPATKYVTISQKGDAIMAASLSNRIVALGDLSSRETAAGHIASDKNQEIHDHLSKVRSKLNDKVSSGGYLSFDEAVKIGSELDEIAAAVKRYDRTIVITEEIALRPMVIESTSEPTGKRLSIFTQSVKGADGVTTTKTTRTEETTVD